MIATRLYHLAETTGMFSPLQAGFRKGRGCDDQIAKIIQAIEKGFQAKRMERSVLVLLDFSKAYDTVWRERLLLSMLDKRCPNYVHSLAPLLPPKKTSKSEVLRYRK